MVARSCRKRKSVLQRKMDGLGAIPGSMPFSPLDDLGEPLSRAIMNDLVEQDNIEATMDGVRAANDLLMQEVNAYKRAHDEMSKNIEHVKSTLLQRNQELLDKDKLITRLRDSVINQEKVDHHKLLIEKKLNERHQDIVRKWQAKVDAQAAEIEILRAEGITMKKDFYAKDAQLQRLTTETIPFKDREINELKVRLREDVTQARQSSQTKMLAESEARSRKLQHENGLLQEQVTHMEAILKEMRSSALANDGAAVALDLQANHVKFESVANNSKKQAEFLTQLNASLKVQLNKLCEENATLEARLLLRDQAVCRLQSELDDTQHAVDQEVAISKADCGARIVQIQRERDVGQREIESLHEEINAERDKNARLSEQLMNTETDLKQQLEHLRSNVFLQQRLFDEQKVKAENMLNEQQRQKTDATVKLQHQVDAANHAVEDLRNELHAKMLEIGQLKAHVMRIRTLESQISDGLQERSKLRDQLDKLADEINLLQRHLQERDSSVDQLKSNVTRVTELFETEKVRRHDECKSLRHSHEEETRNLNRDLEESRYQLQQMQAKYALLQGSAKTDAEQTHHRVVKLQEAVQMLRSDVEKKDAKLQTFAANGVKVEDYVMLRDEVDSWRKKHDMFKKLLSTTLVASPPIFGGDVCRTGSPLMQRNVLARNTGALSSPVPPPELLPPAPNNNNVVKTNAESAAGESPVTTTQIDSQLLDVKRRADLIEKRFTNDAQVLND